MNSIHTSIYVDHSINILYVLKCLPANIIPIKIQNISVEDECLEASRALTSLLSYPSDMNYLGICITSNKIAIRDPIRLLKTEINLNLNQLELLLTTFQQLPSSPSGILTINSLQIQFINYIESFFNNANGIFCIETNGYITNEIIERPIVYCGTFNPFHIAHKKIMEYMSMRFINRPVVLEISQRSEDKSATSLTNVFIRAAQVAGNYKVVITNTSLYIDKCKNYPGATFVVGYDTAIRILDKKYYQNSEINLKKALQTIESAQCNFIVVGRVDDDSQNFLEFDSVKPSLPAKEFHHLFISLNEQQFRCDMSSTYLRNHGVLLNKNILPKL